MNFLWGTAKNPHDNSRSCGGSSGGSAASIAAKIAPLAFGADIGGSIRCPASFNGVVGLKPGSSRLTSKGHTFFNAAIDG